MALRPTAVSRLLQQLAQPRKLLNAKKLQHVDKQVRCLVTRSTAAHATRLACEVSNLPSVSLFAGSFAARNFLLSARGDTRPIPRLIHQPSGLLYESSGDGTVLGKSADSGRRAFEQAGGKTRKNLLGGLAIVRQTLEDLIVRVAVTQLFSFFAYLPQTVICLSRWLGRVREKRKIGDKSFSASDPRWL